VDSGKLFHGVNYSTCKETAPSRAGTTGFVQLVDVATYSSAWAQLEEVVAH